MQRAYPSTPKSRPVMTLRDALTDQTLAEAACPPAPRGAELIMHQNAQDLVRFVRELNLPKKHELLSLPLSEVGLLLLLGCGEPGCEDTRSERLWRQYELERFSEDCECSGCQETARSFEKVEVCGICGRVCHIRCTKENWRVLRGNTSTVYPYVCDACTN